MLRHFQWLNLTSGACLIGTILPSVIGDIELAAVIIAVGLVISAAIVGAALIIAAGRTGRRGSSN